jgi:cytochrome c-type biogenesis protein CcmH
LSVGLAVALVGLTSLALAMLLVPLLLRQRNATSRDAYNLAVYRDQLAEVERDLARGVLAAGEAEAARTEIARRILALSPAETAPGAAGQAGGLKAHGATPLAAATVAILLLPVAAWMLYWQLGSPAMPDQPYAARIAAGSQPLAANPTHIDMKEAVERLGAHLKEHPEDLAGWLLLARSELSLDRFTAAADAYRQAAELTGNRADIMGDWGEAQVLAAGGTVTPAARAAFEAGLGDPESAPRSRYYLAFAKLQDGDVKGALDAWVALAAEAPADAEWLGLVQQRIAQATKALGVDPATLKPVPGTAAMTAGAPLPGPRADEPSPPQAPPPATGMPSGSAVAAAAKATAGAPPEERQAMINAMVERLAARLEDQPDDVDGWVRLGRSYMVLNQPDKAREAYLRASKLKPDDTAIGRALAEASTAAGKSRTVAPVRNGSK